MGNNKKQKLYKVIYARTLNELEEKVNDELTRGFSICGSLLSNVVLHDEKNNVMGYFFLQTLVYNIE